MATPTKFDARTSGGHRRAPLRRVLTTPFDPALADQVGIAYTALCSGLERHPWLMASVAATPSVLHDATITFLSGAHESVMWLTVEAPRVLNSADAASQGISFRLDLPVDYPGQTIAIHGPLKSIRGLLHSYSGPPAILDSESQAKLLDQIVLLSEDGTWEGVSDFTNDRNSVIDIVTENESLSRTIEDAVARESEARFARDLAVQALLSRLAESQAVINQERAAMDETVAKLRELEVPWAAIGSTLGITGPTVRQRFTPEGRESHRMRTARARGEKSDSETE